MAMAQQLIPAAILGKAALFSVYRLRLPHLVEKWGRSLPSEQP
jgi:hypothetical protein